MYEKIILITRKTRLQELIEKFNTKAQARFYIEHSGANFAEYEEEDNAYQSALDLAVKQIDSGLKTQFVDRKYIPNFVFTPKDLIVAIGQDGLVANVAKYAGGQPIIGVNPDPLRIDGLLVPITTLRLRTAIENVMSDKPTLRSVTLAEVKLNDGQRLLAFNDIFLGAQTHISARYQLRYGSQYEDQSSSGVIVSTGAGSTGWLSSLFNMAAGISSFRGETPPQPMRLEWSSPELIFVVREPFASRHSQANIVAGVLSNGESLQIESRMPAGGTIFSDGIESDFLSFTSGLVATVKAAQEKAQLYDPVAVARRI